MHRIGEVVSKDFLRLAVVFLFLGMVTNSNLYSQDSGKEPELKGLRPIEGKTEESESKQDQDPSESSSEERKKETVQPEVEKPADTRSDLDRLIDEQMPEIDPLDILDANDPTAKVGQLVDEISKNMKEIERLLDGDDTGESNQSMQQQTLSRIDELINEVQKLSGG